MPDIEIDIQVRTALEAVLGRVIPDYAPGLRLFEDLALDSTSLIELLMNLEDQISVEIDADELTPEAFATVASLTAYVEAGLAKGSV
ncbi:acyl carrier protein [Streptosporangium saharense]|uniref:acyl carrier protein n=1 Tax=Streptosporangium saharense TaxID=1706840 RepID=UPI00331C3415